MKAKKQKKNVQDQLHQIIKRKKSFGSKNVNQEIQNLKHQFDTYLQVYKTKTIPIDQLSLILQKFFKQRASLLSEVMLRSSKSSTREISWDNLLQFIHESVNLKDKVAKINKTHFSITQVAFDVANSYQNILRYVLRNQMNRIRKIVRAQMSLRQVLLVHLDGQIIIYDKQQKRFTNHLQYQYIQTQQRILERDKLKKEREKSLVSQQLDSVRPISINKNNSFFDHRKNQSQAKNFLRNKDQSQAKNSLRKSRAGMQSNSAISSAISKKRTQTEISQFFKKVPKKTQSLNMKYKNNQTDKVFKIFQDATLQNSIQIAKSFMDSKFSFKSHVQIEKSWLVKDTSEDIYSTSQIVEKRNFQSEIKQMRQYKNYLTKAGKNQINVPMDQKRSYYTLSKDRKNQLSKKMNKSNFNHFQTLPIQIECFSIFENYILVGLHSRQIRIYSYKRFVQNYKEELILQKTFQYLPISVFLYRSQVRKKLNIAVCLCRQYGVRIVVFQLSQNLQIVGQSFKANLDFTPVFESSLPMGFLAYNQKGWFSVIQLNSPLDYASQRKVFQKCFKDPNQKNPICFNNMKMHVNSFQYYSGSKDGKVYCIDKYSQSIRLVNKVSNNSILDLIFLNNGEDILIYLDNFEIKIVNPVNLEVQFSVQPNLQLLCHNLKLGKLTNQIILLEPQNDRFGIYSERGLQTITVNKNLQKKFNNEKPIKILKSRARILQKKGFSSILAGQSKNKGSSSINQTVAIQRWFIQDHCLAILGQNFQLQIFDSLIQYVGSYHNLELSSLIQMKVSRDLKFLANYYESGDLQVVNIYTQQSILNIIYPNQTIHTLFFADSSQHFLGIATTKNMVYLFAQAQKQSEDKKIKLNLQNYHPEKASILVSAQIKNLSNIIKVMFFKGRLFSWKPVLFPNQQSQINFITIYHQKSYQRNCIIPLTESLIRELKGEQAIFVSQIKSIQNQNSIICALNQKIIIKANLVSKHFEKIYPMSHLQIPKQFLDFGNHIIAQFQKAIKLPEKSQKQLRALQFIRKDPPKDEIIIKYVKNEDTSIIGKIQKKQQCQVKILRQTILLKTKKIVQAYNCKGKLLKDLIIQSIGS